jgi:hypothetical protein
MTSKRKASRDLLLGAWEGIDAYSTNVQYTIRRKNGTYSAAALDTYDNEKVDIFEEKWDKKKGILSFAGYWNSTGRFMRCKIQLSGKDKIEFTYTYTDSETMIRRKETVRRGGKGKNHI